ncbi:MAG TPA: methylamine utilization protein [Methylophilus sp.]
MTLTQNTRACWQRALFILLSSTLMSAGFINNALAEDFIVEVTDSTGKLLSDAVVFLENDKTAGHLQPVKTEIEQKGKQFHPLVTAAQVGASVNFPNRDKVRHHVYSFSPAKKFELKLYSGVPANPVVFDKAGTVVLGCNIHDTMLAFVYLVNTPYFAKTDASGSAKLSQVAAGKYQLKVWHYALLKENVTVDQPLVVNGASKKITVKLEINESGLVPSY